MRTAPPPRLSQGEFPRAPLLGSAKTSAFNKIMMQRSRRSQSGDGLGLGGQNKGLRFGGFSQSFPQHRAHSQPRAHPPPEGHSFAWETEAAGELFGTTSTSHADDTRLRVPPSTGGRNFAFGGGSLTASFSPGLGSPTYLEASPWQRLHFHAVKEPRRFEEAEDDCGLSSVPSSWTSPDAAWSPTCHLPSSSRPLTRHGNPEIGRAHV